VPFTLSHLDVAHTALGLALRLDRIARGKPLPTDRDEIQAMAEELTSWMQDRQQPRCVLFSTPTGLGVTIMAVQRKGKFTPKGDEDPLQPLSDGFARLRQSLAAGKSVRSDAASLSGLFREMHAIAEAAAASEPAMSPALQLVQALAR